MSSLSAGSAAIAARTTATPELAAPHHPTGGITAAADGMRGRAAEAALAPGDRGRAAGRLPRGRPEHPPPSAAPQALAHDAGAPKLHAPFPPAGAAAQPTTLAQTPVQTPRTGNAHTRTPSQNAMRHAVPASYTIPAHQKPMHQSPHRSNHHRSNHHRSNHHRSNHHRSNQTPQHAMPYTVRMARAAQRRATVVPRPSACARPAGAMPANARTSDAMRCNVSRPPSPPSLAHHPTRARRRLIQSYPLAVGTGRPCARPTRSPARANHRQLTHRRRPGQRSRHAMPNNMRNRPAAKPGLPHAMPYIVRTPLPAPHQGDHPEGTPAKEGRPCALPWPSFLRPIVRRSGTAPLAKPPRPCHEIAVCRCRHRRDRHGRRA